MGVASGKALASWILLGSDDPLTVLDALSWLTTPPGQELPASARAVLEEACDAGSVTETCEFLSVSPDPWIREASRFPMLWHRSPARGADGRAR